MGQTINRLPVIVLQVTGSCIQMVGLEERVWLSDPHKPVNHAVVVLQLPSSQGCQHWHQQRWQPTHALPACASLALIAPSLAY